MVETIRLESGHTLTGIVGSNPTLSAIFKVFITSQIARRHTLWANFALTWPKEMGPRDEHNATRYNLCPPLHRLQVRRG